MKYAFNFSLILLTLIAGCRLGPRYTPPTIEIPDQWKNNQELTEVTPFQEGAWWKVFHDPCLDALENIAVNNNKDVALAVVKIAQARAFSGVAKADLVPNVDFKPDYINQRELIRVFGRKPKDSLAKAHEIICALPFVLNYEIDYLGKLKGIYDSAVMGIQKEDFNLEMALLIITTDVAASYYQIRTLDAEIEFLKEMIDLRAQALKIQNDRYEERIIDFEDVARAELELTNTEALYFDTVRLRKIQEDQLAYLLGLPSSEVCLPASPLKDLPPQIPAGLPSEMLLKRPDLAAAERERASEHALIGPTKATFFPSLTLTGLLGFSSPELKQLLSWNAHLIGIGAHISQFVFDGGRRVSHLDLAWANFFYADETYKKLALIAFQETEDALAGIEWLAKQSDSLTESVAAAKTTYQIASDRYAEGVVFYLDVIDSERQQLQSQIDLISSIGNRYLATIHLIKALGGSWCP